MSSETSEGQMTSPLLGWPGAVEAGWPDEGVAAHYGDPMREQRAAEQSAGVVDRSNRGVLRITGQDRLSWLHSLTTQHLERLAAGQGTQALILSPTGHVEHHLTLTDDGTAVWVHVEPGTAGALAEFLDSMRFMMRVEVADVGLEAVLLVQRGDQGADRVGADLRHPAALTAEQVHVVGVAGQVIDGRTVPEVGVGDHPDLLEQFERPVDGGDVDPARRPLHLGADLLRGRVIESCHRLEHELALWRNPVAAGTKLFVPGPHRERCVGCHGPIVVALL